MEHLPIGTAIREARLAAGLTQQVLATNAGLALRTLSRIEAGEDMTMSTLAALADALNLSLPALITSAEPTQDVSA